MVREWYETVREDRIRDHFKRSTEDVTPPPSFDQRNSGYYERNSNRIVNDSSDQYIRRQNSYHPGDLRNNRQRDRIYRNGPSYPSIVERSTPVSHHRVPSWYDTSPNAGNGSGGNGGGSSTVSGSGASPVGGRSVYGNVASAVVQPDTSGFDCQLLKKKKSRSGSESPCDRIDRLNDRLIDRNDRGGDRIERLNSGGSSSCADREQRNNGSGRDCGSAASSRSHSRSPSSCSSTNSTSSNNSHVSSPVSGSDPPQSSSSSSHRTQISSSSSSSTTRHHIQSAVSAPSQSGMICNINNHNSSNLISTGVNNNNNNNNNSNNNNISINNNNSNNNNNINNNNSNINNNNNNSNNNNNNILVNSTNIASVATTTTSSNIINNNNTNNSNLNNNNNSSSSSGNPVVHSEDNRPLAICVRNLPARSSDTSLKDGLFHEYKKHGKVTWVKVVGQNSERYALVCFKKPEDVEKALEVSHDKLFFGCKIEVAPYQGYDVEDNEFRPYEAELDEYHPKSTRTLFIGNLEKDITSSELRKHFECFGEIIEIDIKKQGMNAYAFCQYSDIVSVVKAMRKMDGEHLGSNRIKLGFGKSMPTSCVWIDGIADSVSENHLTGQFSRYGPVTQVCIDRERKLALVSFDQIQYAQTAVKEMRGATLRGRKLQVDFASRECQEAFYDKIDKQNNSTGDIRNLQKERFHLLEQLEECPSSGDELVSPKKRMKFDHSSHHHNHHHTLSNYQQSNPIDCSNSSNSMQQPTNIAIGESNCDVLGNHSNDLALLSTSSNSLNLHNHRKCVEVRRLSECNSLKYGNQMLNCNNSSNSNINSSSNNSRRPSIESGALSSCNPNSSSNSSINSIRQTTLLPPQQQQQQQISGNDHPTNNNNNSVFMQTHQSCKRRRMGSSIQIPTGSNNTNNSNNGSMSLLQPSSSTSIGSTSGGSINISIGQDVNEYHSSRGRGHQLHSHHSHEASGGESADGSRPGTPLCDERPEVAPSEPRRIPRDRPHEPMMLPIPKWGIQFVQQHKSIATPAALSSHAGQYYTSLNSSSLSSVNPSNNNLKIFNSSSSALLNSNSNHSSLLNSLSSPPLLAGTRLHPISSVNASSSSTHSQQQLQQQSHNQSSSITISSSSSSSAPHHHHHHHGQHGHHSGTNQTSSASSVSQQHHRHHHSQNQLHIGTERENSPLNKQSSGAATSPLRARSLSSNSSDSDTVTLETGPSMEERIKALDEMFEKWSGNSSVNSSLINRPHTLSSNDLTQNSNITPANYSAINTPSLTSSFLSRHKFLDLDVNEMKPSEIAKSVLGKKSIFDDDYQRLKNINDKYEPGDFSNIVKTPPAIPNLAATKTPVVGCSSLLGTTNKPPTPVSTVFSAPSNLQRLNSSPMNSPQASVSPYNSPSPSPNIALCSTKPTSIIQPQPAKGLQYPFPSHPPSSLVPALSTGNSNATCNSNISSGNATEAQNIPTKLTENKSKTVPILKSYSVPNDKHLVSSQNSSSSSNCSVSPSTTSVAPTPSRTLTKSISVPGSTNSGTVKVSNISSFSTSSALPSNNANKIDEMETDSIKSSTAQLLCQSQLKTSNSSKKTEKLHKQNSKSDSDNKKINSRTEKSIEKSKSEEFDIDTEIDRERQKKEQEEREKLEYERLQQEQIEKEKQQRLEKEKQERERREREVQKKREKEEKEERERKEREEKERKEREEEERKEREEKERREREQKERKEQEEKEKREREEKERREKEEQENREREEQERIEREEKERKIREEKERKEREEKERREREIKEREDYEKREMERKECEERLRREHEEKLRVEREERERKEYETKQQEEKERREREENDRQEREEHERKKLEEFEQRKQNETDYHRKEDHEHRPKTHLSESDTQIKHFEEDNIEKGKSVGNLCRNNSLQINDNENNSEEIQNHPNKENSEIYMQDDLILHKRRDRSKSGNSPIRNTKRRLSSQESIIDLEEHHKRIRIASSGENRKILDRRDSKEPNCKISKHSNLTVKTQQHNRSSSLSSKNCEEKMNYSVDERYRKDSGFDERKHSKEKIKYHFSPISGSLIKQKKQESYNSDIEKDIEINSSDRNNVFSSQDLRSTDEEDLLQHAQHHHTSRPHKSKKKEKRHDHDMEDNSLRQLPEHTTAGRNSESSNQKKHDKYQQDRKQQSSRSEECSNSGSRQHHSSEKPRGKLLSGSRKPPLSSDETNSDEPKKHSIFDIPDDGPYVSMYDKVKARSCKNMQKQEEEKKIKAKFSQLKQCRAKREEKKRSTSYDGDSDSDFDIGEHRSGKYRSKSSRNASGFISSSDDSSLRPQREGIISDSDSDHRLRRMQYNRARLNNLCDDDDTSTDDIQNPNRQHSSNSSAKKITVKRNSRGTRITSETSDSELDKKDQIIVDQDKIKISTNNDDEISFKTEIKKEIDIDDDDKTQSSSGNLQEHYSVKSEKVKSEGHIKLEIKRELYNPYHECISESDNNMSSIPSQAENKDSIFNQLFSPEGRKKHKKNKKRQKTPIPTNNSILMEVQKFEDSADNKGNMSSSMEHVFDELKREHLLEKQQHQTPHIVSHVSIHSSSQHSEKKKHKDRKEKKREKYHRNDEIDKSGLSKEERHRLKKSKKASKAAAAASQAISTTTESPNIRNYTNYDASVITAASKRSGEMVENLFGPLSDEESQLSPTDTAVQKDLTVKNITPNNINSNLEDQTQNICIFKQEPLTPKSHTVEENEENKLKISSIERERHRKEKREKKRKEREKSREQHALSALQNKFSAEDDNSVDLDEAGRVLEAQLLADSITAEDQTPSTATTHKSDMTDVFRFSDHDENSMEIVSMTEKKESEHHKNKDKKKKKKKSKEDRHHPKREHHHHNSNNVIMMSPPPSTNSNNNKLSILISTPNAEHRKSPICKPSPSLPCLTDDDGPIANLNDTPILSSNDNKKINDLELSVSPISQEKVVEIQKPKTPTIPEPSSVKSIEIKKKPEKFIPGFDGELDEKISESAVQSISAEFTSPVIDPVPEEPKIPIASPPGSNKITDKEEEKSRVVISQEETEDAVAALLGESFGNSSTADYSFNDDPIDVPSEEVDASTEAIATTIPEEDAEEMRKAVQSLSTAEDIDIKPDTPQSENDLQIDTDTEEQDDDNSNQFKFENCPKTPDVDLSQITKISDESSKTTEKAITSISIDEKAIDKDDGVNKKHEEEICKEPVVIKSKEIQKTDNKKDEKQDPKEKIPEVNLNEQIQNNNCSNNPVTIRKPVVQTIIPQQQSKIERSSPTIPSSPTVSSSKTNLVGSPITQTRPQFPLQPPTISIPEPTHFTYPQTINVARPSTPTGDVRLQSPRQISPQAMSISQQQHISAPNAAYTVNLRMQSPHSPNIIRGQNSPIRIQNPQQNNGSNGQHVLIQQRQILSPPNANVSLSNPNIVMNRMPVTTVLSTIPKALQPTSIILPQSTSAQTSISNIVSSSSSANTPEPKQEIKMPTGQTLTYQSTRVNIQTQPVTISQHKIGNQNQNQLNIKSVIENSTSQQLPQGINQQPQSSQASQHIQHIIAQQKTQQHQTIILQQPAAAKQIQQQNSQRISPQQIQQIKIVQQHQQQHAIQQQRQQMQHMQQKQQLHQQQHQLQQQQQQQQQQQHQSNFIQKIQQSAIQKQQQHLSSQSPNPYQSAQRALHHQPSPILQVHQFPQSSQPTIITPQPTIIQTISSQNKDNVSPNNIQMGTSRLQQNVVIVRQSPTQNIIQQQPAQSTLQQQKVILQPNSQSHQQQQNIQKPQHIAIVQPQQHQMQMKQVQQPYQQHVSTQPVQIKLANKPNVTENIQFQQQSRKQIQLQSVHISSVQQAPGSQGSPQKIPTPTTEKIISVETEPSNAPAKANIVQKPSSNVFEKTTSVDIVQEPVKSPENELNQDKIEEANNTMTEKSKNIEVEKNEVVAIKTIKEPEPPAEKQIIIPNVEKNEIMEETCSKDQDTKPDLKNTEPTPESESKIIKESENISVIKLSTSPPVTTQLTKEKSLLTEENVNKLSAPEEDQIEQDSKEDSDYWSAKEINIDSVIKKVDALCDETVKINEEKDKLDVKPITSSDQNPNQSVTTDIKSTELLEKDNEDTAEEEKEKISITLEKNEDTHDEDEIDTEAIVESNSNKQISKVPKRSSTRGNRGGKKMPPVNVAQTESTSSTSTLNEGVKTRRGSATVITPSTRGRKGRPSTKSVVTAINEKKTTKSNISQNVTDQDVYEFHDDSGEETTSKIPPVSERPRLILTIKSPGQTPSATITTSSTTSSNQSNIPQSQPSVTTHSNVQSKAAEKQDDLENVSSPLGPPPPPPSPASCGTQQESKDGQHSNTRKSRRLQEKDRSTVDDIIEDVVRNSAPSPKGNQTPPRRSTRNQQQTPSLVNEKLQQQQSQQQSQHLSAIIDNKTKSPRPNRRTKDRKSSDASIGSSDEKDSINKSSDEKVPDDSVNKSIEQIDESKKAATINPSTPTVNSEYDKVDKKKAAAQANTNTANINISPQESLSLIDPVTGVLTVVRQNQEGQYVTVCGKPKQIYTSIEIEKMQKQQTLVTTEKVKSENKELNKTDKAPQQVKVSTPEVNVSIPSTATPHKATSVVVSTPQQQQQLQSVTSSLPTQPATVVVTQSQNQSQLQPQAQSIVIQPQLPQQQNIRTHPLKAHVLNSQKHLQQQQQEHQHQQHHQSQIQKQQQILQNAQSPSHQIQSQSQMIKMNQTQQQIAGSTSVSSSILVSNPNHVIQQNVVVAKHISNPNEMQHSPKLIQSSTQHQTLIVNAPQSASNSPHQPQMLSPHLQQVHQQQQHSSQQQQQHSVPLQVQQQVITNNHPGQPVVHVLAKQQGNIQHPPVVIHSTKQQINHQIGGQHQNHPAYVGPTIVQGGKVIQSTQNNQNTSQQQPATVAIQTAGNKHQTIHVPIPPVHISHQKQPSQSGGVSVVTSHTLSKSQQSGQQIHVQSQLVGQIPQQVGQQQHLSAAQKMNQQILQQLGALGPNASPAIIQQHITRSGIEIIPSPGPINQSSSQGQHIYATHPNPTQQQIANASLMQQTKTVLQQSQQGPQQQMPSQVQQQQISGPPKGAISIHQGQQIMTGAVASPPPIKQQHISTGQQPLVTGAGTLRVSVPTISPQGQARAHMIQPGMPVSAFEANLGEGTFPPNQMRGAVPKEHYIIYQQYLLDQARKPYISRSPLIPGLTDQKELSEMEETMAASPPLELRRPGSGPRSIAIPHGLQSPQDRTSDSPQAAQVYVHTRIPHPHFPDGGPRYFENVRQLPTEPPPAHRPTHTIVPPPSGPSPHNYGPHPLPPSPSQLAPVPTGPGTLVHIHPKAIEREREREREQREREQREKERISIPGGHTSMPSHGSLVPAMPTPGGRNCQVATPPHASQVPQQADSLLTLLQRYPVMWQGILALKTDQAAVQMHFVFGNPLVARGSLPCNSDGSTPPLRIAQRMRLEQVQLEGVTKKMQYENEHCMLLALPCGRDHMDVLQQSRNLQTGFITYLQQKMAAGIVNIPLPGSEQPAYVVHIFPSCDFANENLERAAPDLKHRVAEIAHLLIVIATV